MWSQYVPLLGALCSSVRHTSAYYLNNVDYPNPVIADDWPGLIVNTTSGILHGAINDTAPSVRQWLGVPFAQAPVGPLRFAMPQPLSSNASSQHLAVKTFGPSCPQYESTTPSVYNKIIREFFIWGSSGDDCLSVSIWAPRTPVAEKLPVFIWIYGGGDTTGGSSVPYQNPQKWVQRTQSHIVVSLQYRMNFFGSPNGPFANGTVNLGFFDVRLAMEWTRDNIAAFGGDPTKMVLWGQSAGAGMTGQQSLAYNDDPIVTGYIQESGATYGVFRGYGDTTYQNFTFMAHSFGCTGSDSNLTACLREVPQADIESFIQYWVDADKMPALSFSSNPDNVTTFANSTQAYIDGKANPLPKILAHNQMDGASLIALPPYPYDTPPNATAELATSLGFRCPTVEEARLRTSLNMTTYRYMYAGNFSNISPYYWMGGYHSSELPMLFGTYGDYRGVGTPFQAATSQTMQDYYLAFVNDPVNGPSRMGWPKYATGVVEVFGANGSTHQYVPKAEIEDICNGYVA